MLVYQRVFTLLSAPHSQQRAPFPGGPVLRLDRQHLPPPESHAGNAALHAAAEDFGELLAAQRGAIAMAGSKEVDPSGGWGRGCVGVGIDQRGRLMVSLQLQKRRSFVLENRCTTYCPVVNGHTECSRDHFSRPSRALRSSISCQIFLVAAVPLQPLSQRWGQRLPMCWRRGTKFQRGTANLPGMPNRSAAGNVK